ncbi:MAG: hypothetical protein IJO20_00690 [Ruminococcus sp.]|nr:hypothetical protein [Ruminococcus sp.]
MKFCSSCRKLCSVAEAVCADCNKGYNEINDINEPVLICVVGGVDRSVACGALNDANIPFVEKQYGKIGVSNEIVTGYDAKLLNIAIEVPYSAVPKAYEALASVGVECKVDDDILEQTKADIEEYKRKMKNDDIQMSDKKRTAVRVLSAIAFIVLVALVIWGTDYVMELIKNLFGG